MKIHKKQKCISKAIFPIIVWKKCCICDEKFGFEFGYKYIAGDSRLAMVYYMCWSCGGHDIESSDEIFMEHILNNRVKSAKQWPPPTQGSAIYRPQNNFDNDNYITIIKETK